MRTFLKHAGLIVLATMALGMFAFDSPQAAAAERPNLVFIIADDCTFRDIGCYGGQALTPRIDALATTGMSFRQCFQTAPMCSPTRHNIYTGLYPVASGAYPNHTFAKEGTKSVVHYLQPLGYRVHLSGKKHINPKSVFPFETSGASNPSMPAIDTLMSDCAKADTPFCLFACSNEPHSPWNKGDASQYQPGKLKLPPYLVDTPLVREQFANYLAEITYFDSQVGDILDLLDKHKLADNTLVMVVSEQGNSFPFAKWTCYEAGLGSAMIVRWPGKVKAASETAALVEYVDILPTFVEAAGDKPSAVLQGESFLPVLLGARSTHKELTFGIMTTRGINNGNESYPIRSVRDQKYRLIWNLNHTESFQNACTNSPEFQSMLKAAKQGNAHARTFTDRYQNRPEFELFDVQADPHNLKNLAGDAKFANDQTRLIKELKAWMKQQGDRGIATELEAHEHQGRGRSKKTKQPKKKTP